MNFPDGLLGQRTGYILTIVLFGIGSILSATAPNIDTLIAGWILQGVASGIGQPLAMYSMFRVFPPERRGLAIGIYGLGSVLAPTFGPILGGIAIDTLSWRYLFLLPLPICAPALLMSLIFMPHKRYSSNAPAFDWTGFILIFIAIFSLLSGLSNGPRMGWGSDYILIRLLGGVGVLMVFIYWELRAEYPILDLTLFREHEFRLTMLSGFVFGAGLFASSYFVPVFVQTIQGYSATRAGFLLAPGGLIMMLFFPLAGRITNTIPAHIPIAVGLLVFAVGCFLIQAVDVNTTFLRWWPIPR
ncbi:MAG: EmrB/QacA subfamily drug resistance transporter [Alphaproteobacteria bacterium]|jgi:DHA2 family multidrug resistance protein